MKILLKLVVSATITLICINSACLAQSTTIRVRFINGRSGKPLRLKSYDRGSNTSAPGTYEIKKVEGNSLLITFNNVSEFSFRSRYFEPCDSKSKLDPQPKYSVHEILERGKVAPNYCGHASVQPKPGELIIFSRHEHWWKVTGDIARGLLICG